MKDPAVLFYTSDFLTGTSRFTDEQVGQYARALFNQHQEGHFTHEELLIFLKSNDSPVWKKFIKDENGLYFNKRMDEEIEKRLSYCSSKSHPGKSGRKSKSLENHMNNDRLPVGNHTDNENENEINIDYLFVFDKFRKLYPGTKKGNQTEFENFKKKHKSDWKTVLPILETAIINQIQVRNEKIKLKMFVPEWKNLQTWINQRCWEEETKIDNNIHNQRKVHYKLNGAFVTHFEHAYLSNLKQYPDIVEFLNYVD